jgi:protein ImuB
VTSLSRAGLKTLADLADRPSTILSARFGEELATKLRRMLGHEDGRITPLRPPPACVVERHFAEPMLDSEGLETVVARLVAEAARVLELRGEGGRSFEISFFRSDGAVRRLSVGTGRPSRDAAAILRLWRERVDTLADPLDPGFGFDLIRLTVPEAAPLGMAQTSLDGRIVEADETAALVARLSARFGREHVLRFKANDTHDPDRAAETMPAVDAAEPASFPLDADEPPLRPLQLFDPPQPILTTAEVPDGAPRQFTWRRMEHLVVHAEGPERIAPEWWRKPEAETRDYFRVEDEKGRRFWLFRSGLYGRETHAPTWFVHGVFA